MRFGSVCSGIEAASVAWHPLGWQAAWLAEIEPFPAAVLSHHYPDVPNLGDMTLIAQGVRLGAIEAPDVLVGGTPCQAFSVAGLRESLDDQRGQLTLAYVELANAIDTARTAAGKQPAVIVWENVPGVLSTKDNAFGCFLAGLAGEDEPLVAPGGKWTNAGCVFGPQRAVAWRILDAQYFGVAQRRRRVFVVASARNGFNPAQVLFEFYGLRRDSAPSREKGQEAAGTLDASLGRSRVAGTHPGAITADKLNHWDGELYPHPTLCASHNSGGIGASNQELFSQRGACLVQDVTATLDASYGRLQGFSGQDANHGHSHLVVHGTQDPDINDDLAHPLGRNQGQENALCVSLRGRDGGATAELGGEVMGTLRTGGGGGDKTHVLTDTIGWSEELTAHYELAGTLQRGGNGGRHDGVAYPHASREVAQTLTSNYGKQPDNSDTALGPNLAIHCMAVRRLTPVECERLQGFPDGYTMVPWRSKPAEECPDGPRYKELGNSMAVPCMAFIGSRIQIVLTGKQE